MITEETIELVHGRIVHCQHGVYDKSSVLEGQPWRQVQEEYATVEEAIAAHPKARVSIEEDDAEAPLTWSLSDTPPSWFDTNAAGEVWHEDDY